MTSQMKNDKLDKRAAALRNNLKRRKAKAKSDKELSKKSNKESEDDTAKSE